MLDGESIEQPQVASVYQQHSWCNDFIFEFISARETFLDLKVSYLTSPSIKSYGGSKFPISTPAGRRLG